jgi:hypothetical protein
MLRSIIAAGCLLVATATTASAQAPDFTSQIQPTLTANELLVRQIREAMPVDDLEMMSLQTALTLAAGEQLEQQLSQALANAPNDAARSRVDGVLTHTHAAIESLRLANQEATVDAAQGRLEQARGEAQEGLDELRPFVVSMVRPAELPAELPVAGSLDPIDTAALPLVGVLLMVVGLALRLSARVRQPGRTPASRTR